MSKKNVDTEDQDDSVLIAQHLVTKNDTLQSLMEEYEVSADHLYYWCIKPDVPFEENVGEVLIFPVSKTSTVGRKRIKELQERNSKK